MPPTKIDQINQGVRAFCVLLLLGGFVFAFVYGIILQKIIVDSAAYIGVLTLALTWWFKSRDEKAEREAPTTTTTTEPTSKTPGTTTTTTSGGTS